MTTLTSDLSSLFLVGTLSFFILWASLKRGFFSLEDQKSTWAVSITWTHVIFVFIIYFGVSILLVPFLSHLVRSWILSPQKESFLAYASWLNFLTSFCIFIFLALFLFSLSKETRNKLLRREPHSPILHDVGFALLAWLVSFPLVLFVSQLLEMSLNYLFSIEHLPDQIAVYFLKSTFHHPLYFLFAIITIVFFAPLIEEILFRGFLQSFIRKHLGSKQAILITSICFSLFHYSPEQGFSNIPIIGSLFTLALFLGYVYEKRGNLLSPIALHATFNGISILNLYFIGGFPKGTLGILNLFPFHLCF